MQKLIHGVSVHRGKGAIHHFEFHCIRTDDRNAPACRLGRESRHGRRNVRRPVLHSRFFHQAAIWSSIRSARPGARNDPIERASAASLGRFTRENWISGDMKQSDAKPIVLSILDGEACEIPLCPTSILMPGAGIKREQGGRRGHKRLSDSMQNMCHKILHAKAGSLGGPSAAGVFIYLSSFYAFLFQFALMAGRGPGRWNGPEQAGAGCRFAQKNVHMHESLCNFLTKCLDRQRP
jgi:hypothetical protein